MITNFKTQFEPFMSLMEYTYLNYAVFRYVYTMDGRYERG